MDAPRTLMVAACASAALLAACGSQHHQSAITPQQHCVRRRHERCGAKRLALPSMTAASTTGPCGGGQLRQVAHPGLCRRPGLRHRQCPHQRKPDARPAMPAPAPSPDRSTPFLASGGFAATDVVMVSGGVSGSDRWHGRCERRHPDQDAMVAAARKGRCGTSRPRCAAW